MIGQLPLELVAYVLRNFPLVDLKSFSQTATYSRKIAAPILFEGIRVQLDIGFRNAQFLEFGSTVKVFVKRVTITTSTTLCQDPYPILAFIAKLPNLNSLEYRCITEKPAILNIEYLFKVLPNHQLRHLVLHLYSHSPQPELPALAGIADLETFSLIWDVYEQQQNMVDIFLRNIIQPSLVTLKSLNLCVNYLSQHRLNYDILESTPGLRKFHFFSYMENDEPNLFRIADAIPLVEDLSLTFMGTDIISAVPFRQDSRFEAFYKMQNLVRLELSLDLELNAGDTLDEDHDFAWYLRCLFRRREATQDIAKICPCLEECRWVQLQIDSEGNSNHFRFAISREGSSPVIYTYKEWWMAKRYRDRWLQPLPENLLIDPQDPFIWSYEEEEC